MQSLIEHIAGLTTGQGWNQGAPFQLFRWQLRFLAGAFGREFVQGDVALTCGRGAGKSSLVAAIAEATLDGPLASSQSEAVIVSPTLSQSRICFNHVKRFMGSKLDDKKTWKVWDNAQHSLIEHRKTGQVLRCLGSEPKRIHGIAPFLTVIDEPAQLATNTAEETYSTLRTSMGKIDGGRLIVLGTRPLEGVDHFFNDLLSGEADYVQIHACTKGQDADFQKRSWEKACPSLKEGMPSLLAEIQAEARRAKKNPNLLSGFRALRLNMGSAPANRSHVIDGDAWVAATKDDARREGPYVLGIDLSDGAAQSAAAGYWRQTGRLEGMATFPAIPSLGERGLRDGVGQLYIKCEKRGELFTTPGRAVNVGELLRRVLAEWGTPTVVVADRYRERDLRSALDVTNFPQASLIMRGMGWFHGSDDIRGIRRAFLEGRVHPVSSLLLSAAFREAVTMANPAGDEKLAKATQNGRRLRARDDSAAAAILAIGEAQRRWPDGAPEVDHSIYYGKA